ncbi:MAG: undecaprenyldiphospho-muramoylpentapeptide beta-N-acetylglucosaminyltransferase [Clostridiales bacterium]|nr:undecaprenyldiphospho-muramoylpentapeptide beta-N-acetylglucosaminyltransferase [Clostridiales bacterium]
MKVLFAGGGTGGHINPALALAEYIKIKEPYADIRFAGAQGGMEETLVRREGYHLYTLPLHGLRRSFSLPSIKYNSIALFEAATAVNKAKKIIREFRPDIIIGTGGYASFPVVYGGIKLSVPTALLEVNAMPGFVTRMLSGQVLRVFVSFQETIAYLKDEKKAVLTGNPIRFTGSSISREAARSKLNVHNKPLVVSFWGSLGAMNMNKKMVDFIKLEAEHADFHHIHATGKDSHRWMPEEIKKQGVDLREQKSIDIREYIFNMGEVLSACDLVICRAGASTITEICAVGRPSIIVPSPFVTDNHQEKNARALENEGACEVILEKDCTGESLYRSVKKLLSNQDRLNSMAKNAERLKTPDSCERIYQIIKTISVS